MRWCILKHADVKTNFVKSIYRAADSTKNPALVLNAGESTDFGVDFEVKKPTRVIAFAPDLACGEKSKRVGETVLRDKYAMSCAPQPGIVHSKDTT
jgi:hypothetical protein